MATPEEKQARKEAREAARAQRRYERLRSHVVTCPACGAEALDHMTKCPKCGAELTPTGYKPMDEQKRKRIRTITYTIGAVIVIAAIVLTFIFA